MSGIVKELDGTMWVFAAILIGLVVVQSLLFLRLALSFNKKTKLMTKSEIGQAARTGLISVIGPASSSIVVALSLISMVGGGVAFMRCGVIGAPSFELMMAEMAAATLGVNFGSPEFTGAIFTVCIFGMILASAPYFVCCILALKPMDMMVKKSSEGKKKKESFLPDMSKAAILGMTSYYVLIYMTEISTAISLLSAALVAYLLMTLAKKTGKGWINDWGLTIAMLIGMPIGLLVSKLI